MGFFNVGGEDNPQAWYSSLLLALCSLLLYLVSVNRQRHFISQIRCWRTLSFAFLYLSIDEMLLFHERVGEWLSHFVHTNGIFRYTWVILAIPICFAFGIVFLRFLFSLPQKICQLFIVSAGVYIGSALILELAEGYLASIYGERSLFDFLLVAIEVLLEKLGVILFIYALLLHLESQVKEIHFKASRLIVLNYLMEVPV